MEILHQTGWRGIWNIDTHYKNGIGDGFIFCVYSYPYGEIEEKYFKKYKGIIDKSFIDLQYFGKKESGNIAKGNLDTYPFHPAANKENKNQTDVFIEKSIKEGIKYQLDIGLKNIIIPNFYENVDESRFFGMVKTINRWLIKNKQDNVKYFMTVPIANHTIIDANKIDNLLYCLTDMDIVFDGYYIICEAKPENRQKLNTDFKYFNNLSRVFEVLKKQKFITIYAYANWDALIFLATSNIDYITIATYENLRNFNIKRFLVSEDGGPSKGWYFSEKLLNFVKAQLIDLVRMQQGIDIIKNDKNIFSDAILQANYAWSNQKAEVHKNYLLAVDRLLKEVAAIDDLKQRKKFVIQKIDSAINAYDLLERKNIFLTDESKNYHLDTWKSYLLTK